MMMDESMSYSQLLSSSTSIATSKNVANANTYDNYNDCQMIGTTSIDIPSTSTTTSKQKKNVWTKKNTNGLTKTTITIIILLVILNILMLISQIVNFIKNLDNNNNYITNNSFNSLSSISLSCGSGSWVKYKNEKCYLILNHTLRTFSEANESCSKLSLLSPSLPEVTLPVIQSQEEQEFLANYLFYTNGKNENFWIGAIFDDNDYVDDDDGNSGHNITHQRSSSVSSLVSSSSSSKYRWITGDEWIYDNWARNRPQNRRNYCAHMIAEREVMNENNNNNNIGLWSDELCEKKNFVVCQRFIKHSLTSIQKLTFGIRNDLAQQQILINQLKAEQIENRMNNEKMLHMIEMMTKQQQQSLNQTLNIAIPIGFIYIQLANSTSPTVLWPTLQWTDVSVSAGYGGLFFRVTGGLRNDVPFDQIQAQSQLQLPRLERMKAKRSTIYVPSHLQVMIENDEEVIVPLFTNTTITTNNNNNLTTDSWSKPIYPNKSDQINYLDTNIYNDINEKKTINNIYDLQFEHSPTTINTNNNTIATNEVRPRNMAIRIWKRTG